MPFCDPPFTFAQTATGPSRRDALLENYKSVTNPRNVTYQVAVDTILDTNGHVPTAQLQAKYTALQDAGHISATLPVGVVSNTTVETNITKDRAFVTALRAEFCFYYNRWRWALDAWVTMVTSNWFTTTDANDLLNDLRTLNLRCIFLVEFANFVAQKRIPPVQADADSIASLNTALNSKLDELTLANNRFSQEKATVITQREMVRYTASKNAATSTNVMMWSVANVVALGAIGAMYAMM